MGEEQLNVEPDQLDKYAASMTNLADQTAHAEKYVSEWFSISAWDARIYAHVHQSVENVRQSLESNYARLRVLADSSAAELATSAKMYRETDRGTAQHLDSTYGGAHR